MDSNKGCLFLIPVGIATGTPHDYLPASTLSVIQSVTVFIVEDLRSARRFLKSAGYARSFDETQFIIFNEHTRVEEIFEILRSADEGKSIGLLSEAGLPCVADPGSIIVAMAHEKGVKVVPLIGPSSIMLALMASGMNGQHFVFHGYLPVQKNDRSKALREVESNAKRSGFTQIFIETPYRNAQMLETIVEVCSESTMLCIACDIGVANGFVLTKRVGWWRKNIPSIHKRPAVFLINR